MVSNPCLRLQVCLLDLQYNLPVQVRDTAMTEEGAELAALPGSDVGKEYALQRMTEDGTLGAAFAKQQANDTILRLQRTGPYYKVRQGGRRRVRWGRWRGKVGRGVVDRILWAGSGALYGRQRREAVLRGVAKGRGDVNWHH